MAYATMHVQYWPRQCCHPMPHLTYAARPRPVLCYGLLVPVGECTDEVGCYQLQLAAAEGQIRPAPFHTEESHVALQSEESHAPLETEQARSFVGTPSFYTPICTEQAHAVLRPGLAVQGGRGSK